MARETNMARMRSEFGREPLLREADVILLQEVAEDRTSVSAANRLARDLGMRVAYSGAGNGVNDRGLAILSRYTLRDVSRTPLKVYDLRFHSRRRFALSATVDAPRGAVRVTNAHLDTRLNPSERVAQLQPAVSEGANFRGPRIVGGDFNSNGFYWFERVFPLPLPGSQTSAVERYMGLLGFRSAAANASTFDYLGMRLDWIWVRGFRPVASRSVPLGFSDHHAVWTRLEF
jgi:endonuclease/exonuclease/phosphatase family metal-dependent hydrolase